MTRPPVLLTPGPLTTALETRRAMLRDWGSREAGFIALTANLRHRLVRIAQAEDSHVCVPLQGSGTFAIEAMLGTLIPRGAPVLVLVNGAYGRRMVEICRRQGRAVQTVDLPEDRAFQADDLRQALAAPQAPAHVAVVHCETTTGILNRVEDLAQVTRAGGRELLIDAMSSFGGLPIDLGGLGALGLAASSNKGLEGVPGLGFVLCRRDALAAAEGNAPSLALDLHAQWRGFETDGQWRFTPPVQVVAALVRALDRLDAEGGVAAREARYRRTCRRLVDGMVALGFRPLLDPAVQAPVIVTFRPRPDPRFRQDAFAEGLRRRGYLIYPGKLAAEDSFRIGCIGAIDWRVIDGLLRAVAATLRDMGIGSEGP